MADSITFTLNGKPVRYNDDGGRMLLWVLRTDFVLTGAKYGCGEGLCGACTVLINGEAVRSCQTPVREVRGKDVVTIEGLARDGVLHPVQEAFVREEALQCGFCTPGMILTAAALLRKNPRPTREDVVAGLEDNLCRCGTHVRVIQAVEKAAEALAQRGRR
jgi:aerobic-type carbon monoxide dehydrogenase small subunit (CoxS/CutS family)